MTYDVLNAVKNGYVLTWTHRKFLLRLITVPLIVKLLCFFTAFMLDINQTNLRYVFIMLPSYFTEGWLIAQFIRFILTGHAWPAHVTKRGDKNFDVMLERARGILASIITYVIISVVYGGAIALFFEMEAIGSEDVSGALAYQDNPYAALFAFVALFVSIWAFRLIWLNIPMIILMPPQFFLGKLKGLMPSIYMIATWLLSVIPFYFIVLFFSSVLTAPYSGGLMDAPQPIAFVVITVSIVAEVIVKILATTSIVALLYDIFKSYGFTPVHIEKSAP
tara:strand:- start:106568 stop:107398 length:831 start_codon:yes stop_codon:yes gene_type:complete